MARMLQALKNLEARSSPRPAPRPAAAVSAPVAGEGDQPAAAAPARHAPHDPADAAALHIDFAAAALANLSVSVTDGIWPGPGLAAATCEVATYEVASAAVALDEPAKQTPGAREDFTAPAGVAAAASEPAPRPAGLPPPLFRQEESQRTTPFEKAALRVLTDPIRARPLVELAERVEADVKQTSSRTILLAGVGSADDVHTTLLYTGILMTERQSGDVLLVDADWTSRIFSTALASDRQRGLAELINESASISEVCRPTATSRLFFLPAGLRQSADVSSAGARLETTLKKLASRFALVLIDGGNSAELACTALARQADATYLVVRLGTVAAAAAQAALRDFRAGGARVLGSIAT